MQELHLKDRSGKAAANDARTDQGFILVLVLWAAVLLALLAAGFAASVRSHVHAAASALESARAEALADGGINLALQDLIAARSSTGGEGRFPATGITVACQATESAVLTVRVEDEAGKVNLNLANETLLTAVFSGLGAPPDSAATYAGRIVRYRDGNGSARPGSAERAEYIGAGRALGPKYGPLDTIDELDQVLGLPPDLIPRLKPYVTVHSGVSGIDKAKAASGLLQIMEAASLQTATGGLTRGTATAGVSQAAEGTAARSTGRAFTISALARMPSGVQFVSQAIVEFPSRSAADYALRQWHQGSASLFDAAPDGDGEKAPPC